MIDYANLIHPFQNDPGCSQSQRVMEDLLAGTSKIDARTLADLLNYFTELSSHIKYSYVEVLDNKTIEKGDNWNAFFADSIPFKLAASAKNNAGPVNEKFLLYSKLFDQNPSVSGLQLLIFYFYYSTINKINSLQQTLDAASLTGAGTLTKLIKDKLKLPVVEFIKAARNAHRLFGIKSIKFDLLLNNSVWNIAQADISTSDIMTDAGAGRVQLLIDVKENIDSSFSAVLQVMDNIAGIAVSSLEQSLVPLQDDLKKKHTPHLALLFTFLNIFSQLQDDLNGYQKKHLDFFYQDVLQLKPEDAKPDKVHIVFELQKQLKQYALKKGLLVKADKDKNNTEIDFSINDEIVVNKTQVADIRTLFLNNERAGEELYVEGLYMAIKANTADGIDKDFKDDPKNYPTLGAEYSKYTEPGNTSPKAYPSARTGFVLASPVLLLNEGNRKIDITLTCNLMDNCGAKSAAAALSPGPCCKREINQPAIANEDFPDFVTPDKLFSKVVSSFSGRYIYISDQLISLAEKMGLKHEKVILIRDKFLQYKSAVSVCCDEMVYYKEHVVITEDAWKIFKISADNREADLFSAEQKTFLDRIFTPFTPFKVLFSGEKDWIDPLVVDKKAVNTGLVPSPIPLEMSIEGNDANAFSIKISANITADKPAITNYKKENLKEDLGTNQPVVKIELNDTLKLVLAKLELESPADFCRLEKEDPAESKFISLYHFFRDVVVTDSKIEVRVCGVKNLIVQNDESLQDINGPIYPFGTRPAVIGFDTVNNRNADQEDDPEEPQELRKKKKDEQKKEKIPVEKNLVGPNFYLGSTEIFSKKWKNICVKLNWKEKPADFHDYYKGYLKRFDWPIDCDKKGEVYGLNECEFEVNLALLDRAKWVKDTNTSKTKKNPVTQDLNRELFSDEKCGEDCDDGVFKYSFFVESDDFAGIDNSFDTDLTGLKKYDINSWKGFIRFTLENQDFMHKDYAFVLARQMMALGRFPDVIIESAVYAGSGDTVIVYKNVGNSILDVKKSVDQTESDAEIADSNAKKLRDEYTDLAGGGSGETWDDITQEINANEAFVDTTYQDAQQAKGNLQSLQNIMEIFTKEGKPVKDLRVIIPNEPWTPIISNMIVDYSALAEKTDINLIHLYPYKDTYKPEDLTLVPALFPTFCEEGNLFIGLSDLVPGNNVNILFQLAEATSDSEADPQDVYWHYLSNNQWFSLREGFEILNDATENLTMSGIIEFAFPENMTSDNTVMPAGMFWIKAGVPKNSRAVCETIGIYTQAMQASFIIGKDNDTSRLDLPLKENSVSKLKVADANIKQVTQPYSSFDGRVPELTRQYYLRVSELLRHKGRAIQKFDYERLVLQNFPQVFKTKCINHSFKLDANIYENDFPIAPGYVLIAVIPNLNKILAGESFEPKLPTGLLEKIDTYLSARISPFVKVKAVNPRYEKINFCISVILNKGYDRSYYRDRLAEDLREFLAPWAVGKYDKLSFGECVNKSDVVYFLETREYIDYITNLQMLPETAGTRPVVDLAEICPHTPRSILIAGEIQVCIQDSDPYVLTPPDCNGSNSGCCKGALPQPIKI